MEGKLSQHWIRSSDMTALGIIMQMLCLEELEICGIMKTPTLSGVEGIKTFVGISQKGNVHLWNFISDLASSLCGLEMSGRVGLIDLINREVSSVNVGRESRFKWRTNTTETIEIDTMEELMSLDFVRSPSSKPILGVTNQTKKTLVMLRLVKVVTFTFG
jgi:hypothetical protein